MFVMKETERGFLYNPTRQKRSDDFMIFYILSAMLFCMVITPNKFLYAKRKPENYQKIYKKH